MTDNLYILKGFFLVEIKPTLHQPLQNIKMKDDVINRKNNT